MFDLTVFAVFLVGLGIIVYGWIFAIPSYAAPVQNSFSYSVLSNIGNGDILALSWHPSGQILAIGSSSGLFIYRDGHLDQISDVNHRVSTVSWSSNGDFLATGGTQIDVWRTEDFQNIFSLDSQGSVYWRPLSQDLAVVGAFGIKIWNLDIGELSTQLDTYITAWGHAIAWSPDGSNLAYIQDGKVVIWNINLQSTIRLESLEAVGMIAWNNDSSHLAAAYKDIQIWNVETQQIAQSLQEHDSSITDMVWSSTNLISTDEEGRTIFWNTTIGQIQTEWSVPTQRYIVNMSLNTNGTILATSQIDQTLKIQDTSQGQVTATIHEFGTLFTDAKWNPSGTLIATTDFFGTIKIWDPRSTELKGTLYDNLIWSINDLAWSPDGTKIAGAGVTGKIYIWRIQDRQLISTITAHVDWINSISWSPSGNYLASGGDDLMLNIWDVDSSQLVASLSGHTAAIKAIEWNSIGNYIASASDDGEIRIWDVPANELLLTINHQRFLRNIRWSPSDNFIASIGPDDGILRIWDAYTGQLVLPIDTQGVITGISWIHNDDRIIAAIGGQIATIDLNSEQIALIPDSYVGTASSLDWDTETNRLIVAGGTNKIQLWGLPPRATTLIEPDKVIPTMMPIFSWQDTPEASFYRLQATDLVENVVFEETYPFSVCQNDTCSIESPVPLPSGSYTWRVQTINAAGAGPWSEPLDFTIETCINDSETLTNSINDANASGIPTTICLSQDSTQTFDTPDNGLNALPIITGDITIEGNGATLTRDDTADLFRFFEVAPGGSLTLNNLTLNNGEVDTQGGAILNHGTLTINGSTLTDNYAHHSGGAIYNTGSLTVTNTTFNANSTAINGAGGAIYNTGDANLTATTITHNSARYGGGISNSGSLSLVDTIVNYNQASFEGNGAFNGGGGLINQGSNGTVTISGGEFRGNVAYGRGGGIYNAYSTNTLTIEGSVIADNSSVRILGQSKSPPGGGGIASYGTLSITDTHIVDNTVALSAGGAIYASHQATVQQSCITGNSSTSVYLASGTFDLTNNWWGATDGPSGSGSGSGDSINFTSGYQPFIATGCPLP